MYIFMEKAALSGGWPFLFLTHRAKPKLGLYSSYS